MNLEAIMVSEVSQADKDKYCVFSPICGVLRIKQTNEYNKTETDSQIQRTNQELPKGAKWEGVRQDRQRGIRAMNYQL